jgi:hypothetical protein
VASQLTVALELQLLDKDKEANPCVILHETFLKTPPFLVTNDEFNFGSLSVISLIH